MAESEQSPKNSIDTARQWGKKASKVILRWFFLLSLLLAAVLSIFVWYFFVWKNDWSEEKKQQYISEQAKFSFNKTGYQKLVDMMSARKYKFENFPPYSGKDIFFPEGF